MGKPMILVISHDVIGKRMAGPGIRYFQLARVLAPEFRVMLMIPEDSGHESASGIQFVVYASGEDEHLQRAIREARVIVVPAIEAASIPALRRCDSPIVVDGYDPYVVESLHLGAEISGLQNALSQAYLLGDFFICASERQRLWWLGLLEAHGRINSYTFAEDPSLRRLVDVVPFGLPEEPPRAPHPVIKGVWPGIEPTDKVILWGGGLWPWLDPLTVVRAITLVSEQRRDVRLVFPGTHHPNPHMANIPTHRDQVAQLARELGLWNRTVFFGEWIPHADWPGVLLESDVALTLHYDTVETRLAFRSRLLDYVWAGIPIVATLGDATSDLVEKYQLGVVVDYEDDRAVAAAILKLLEVPKGAWEERFEKARRELTWAKAARPLVEFCRHPRRAPDREMLGERLGNPYYVERLAHLRAVVKGYENGRFIRLMRWVHQVRQSVGWVRK